MGRIEDKLNYWTIEEYDLLYEIVPHTWYNNRGYDKDIVRSMLIQKKKKDNEEISISV